MEGKDDEEKGAEVVKHFDEKVPRQADVGFQVRDGEAVGGGYGNRIECGRRMN